MFYIILTLDLTIFCCLSQLPRHCDTNHGTGITIYGQNIQRKNGEKEEKARIPKKPVLRKPYITPGFGPLALKYGSIVMGKSLKTGLVAYNEEKFQEFCDMVSDALQKKEKLRWLSRTGEKMIFLKSIWLFFQLILLQLILLRNILL